MSHAVTESIFGPSSRLQWCHDVAMATTGSGTFSSCRRGSVSITYPGEKPTAEELAGRFISWAFLNPAHDALMYVTPEQYEDDVNALIYYGTLGLVDPTIPGEIKLYQMRGWSFRAALGLTFSRMMLGFVLFMWIVDPHDKREGGVAETEWYRKWSNLENYSLPEGW